MSLTMLKSDLGKRIIKKSSDNNSSVSKPETLGKYFAEKTIDNVSIFDIAKKDAKF